MPLRCYLFFALAAISASAQQVPGAIPGATSGAGYRLISPIAQPTLTTGQIQLLELEGRFQDDVAKGGGKAFASWFAEDAVTLANGKPAVLGRGAIAAAANWNPQDYSLTWNPEGAQMGPANDMGFTWGRYFGKSKDANGNPIVTTGRYITIWKKQPDGAWKVAMDASSDAPAEPGSCCALPKP
jgi:ketosteroid isomerase-like protein